MIVVLVFNFVSNEECLICVVGGKDQDYLVWCFLVQSGKKVRVIFILMWGQSIRCIGGRYVF